MSSSVPGLQDDYPDNYCKSLLWIYSIQVRIWIRSMRGQAIGKSFGIPPSHSRMKTTSILWRTRYLSNLSSDFQYPNVRSHKSAHSSPPCYPFYSHPSSSKRHIGCISGCNLQRETNTKRKLIARFSNARLIHRTSVSHTNNNISFLFCFARYVNYLIEMDIEYLLFTSDSVLIDMLFPEDNEILDKTVED